MSSLRGARLCVAVAVVLLATAAAVGAQATGKAGGVSAERTRDQSPRLITVTVEQRLKQMRAHKPIP